MSRSASAMMLFGLAVTLSASPSGQAEGQANAQQHRPAAVEMSREEKTPGKAFARQWEEQEYASRLRSSIDDSSRHWSVPDLVESGSAWRIVVATNDAPETTMTIPAPAALHHTCFLVRDLEGTARKLSNALGIGPWNVWTITPEYCRVHGQESPFAFRVALATVGGGTYELVAPFSGRSVYNEHLEQHGEGFHHTCLVYPTMEAVRQAMSELRKQGRQPIQEAGAGDRFHFAYFPFPEIGSLIEVLYLDPGTLGAPEVVIRPSS